MSHSGTAIEGWHWLRSDMRLGYEDNRLVAVGKPLQAPPGQIELCKYGMHASTSILEALRDAPGPVICRVVVSEEIVTDDDKLAGRTRTVLWMRDATEDLRSFARWCALQVAHLWDPPSVVVEYLRTGDPDLRDAAQAAAQAAARDAAWAAAQAAAWNAARAAARDAVRAAAWNAAWDAAWNAVRDATWNAVQAVQEQKLLEIIESGPYDTPIQWSEKD